MHYLKGEGFIMLILSLRNANLKNSVVTIITSHVYMLLFTQSYDLYPLLPLDLYCNQLQEFNAY